MSTPLLGNTIIKLDAIDSTNDYARELLLNDANITEGTTVIADFQEKGKGQRGRNWSSEKGLNLTMSVILYPVNLKLQDLFVMTKVTSLGVLDYLKSLLDANLSDQLRIKWPNDIYVANNKICGILIENNVRGDLITSCIIGIGLNVNQVDFPDDIVNPTSIKRELERSFDLDSLRVELCASLEHRYSQLHGMDHGQLGIQYEDCLYGRNEMKSYQIKGQAVSAKLVGVSSFGELMLESADGGQIICNHEEIQYLS